MVSASTESRQAPRGSPSQSVGAAPLSTPHGRVLGHVPGRAPQRRTCARPGPTSADRTETARGFRGGFGHRSLPDIQAELPTYWR